MLVISLGTLPGVGGTGHDSGHAGALLSAESLAEATPRKPAPPLPQPDPLGEPQAITVGGAGHPPAPRQIAGCPRLPLCTGMPRADGGLAHAPRAPPALHA